MSDIFEYMNWELASNIIKVVLGLGTILGVMWALGGNFFAKLKSVFLQKRKSDLEIEMPKRSVILIQSPQESWWHMGKRKDLPIMQIVTHWHATNITKRHVRLLSARLLKPKLKDKGSHASVIVRHPDSNIYGDYPIRPGATVPCNVSFYVGPPTCKPGEPLSVVFEVLDQYGNAHRIEEIELRNTG